MNFYTLVMHSTCLPFNRCHFFYEYIFCSKFMGFVTNFIQIKYFSSFLFSIVVYIY